MTIQLNGKDSKELNFNEFKTLISKVGMNWYGAKNITRSDIEMFEDKFDGFTFELTNNNSIKIWDLDFDYT